MQSSENSDCADAVLTQPRCCAWPSSVHSLLSFSQLFLRDTHGWFLSNVSCSLRYYYCVVLYSRQQKQMKTHMKTCWNRSVRFNCVLFSIDQYTPSDFFLNVFFLIKMIRVSCPCRLSSHNPHTHHCVIFSQRRTMSLPRSCCTIEQIVFTVCLLELGKKEYG